MGTDGNSRPDQEPDERSEDPAHRGDEPEPQIDQGPDDSTRPNANGPDHRADAEAPSALSQEGILYFRQLVGDIEEMLQFAQKRGIEIPDTLREDLVRLFSVSADTSGSEPAEA